MAGHFANPRVPNTTSRAFAQMKLMTRNHPIRLNNLRTISSPITVIMKVNLAFLCHLWDQMIRWLFCLMPSTRSFHLTGSRSEKCWWSRGDRTPDLRIAISARYFCLFESCSHEENQGFSRFPFSYHPIHVASCFLVTYWSCELTAGAC